MHGHACQKVHVWPARLRQDVHATRPPEDTRAPAHRVPSVRVQVAWLQQVLHAAREPQDPRAPPHGRKAIPGMYTLYAVEAYSVHTATRVSLSWATCARTSGYTPRC